MKKIDKKVEFIAFEPSAQDEEGNVYGVVTYNVRKLRRMKYTDLRELLYEKTLQIYPFAIVDKALYWDEPYTKYVAMIPVKMPLSPKLRLSPAEGDFSNER
jgi:hypothetical protein